MRIRREFWPAIVAAVLGIGLYALTLGGTYVYDDMFIANLDPRLHDTHKWSEYLTRAYFPRASDRLFRPVTSFSFALQWWAHGDRPWAMHLVNVLLYAAVCAAVAELARRLAGLRVALVAAVLFAVHPVHVEAVAYLVGRADLLATLGILVALLLFIAAPMTLPRALAIFACLAVAVLSKETGMLLPAVLLAFAPWRRRHLGIPRSAEKTGQQALLLILCWSLAAYIVFREQSRVFKFSWDPMWIDWTMNPLVIASRLDRLLVPFSNLGRYVQLLAFPWRLSLDYSGWTAPTFDAQSLPHFHLASDPFFYLGIATVVAWWVAAIVSYRRSAYACFGALVALAATYSIVSNFGALMGANIGERLIFLPSVFFVLLVAMALARLPRVPLVAATACLAVLGVVRTETYARLWNDRMGLYYTLAADQPDSVRLKILVIDALLERGDYDEAARLAVEARTVSPEYWRAWYYGALTQAHLGNLDEAERLLRHIYDMKYGGPGAAPPLLENLRSGEFKPATRRSAATAPTSTPTTSP